MVSFRDGAEDGDDHAGQDERAKESLQENRVLDLSQGRFFDPDLTIKDFANDVAPLVLRNPRLIFVAVRRIARIKGGLVHIVRTA